MRALHIGYVLKVYPRLSETFILNEILELERQGSRVTIFSLRTAKDGRFHAKLARVGAEVVYIPEVNPEDLFRLVARHAELLAPNRERLGAMLWSLVEAGDSSALRDFGKALAIHLALLDRDIDHLHAHFATQATAVSMIVSRLSGIPYSFTAHAKDIYQEDNPPEALRRRMRSARFVVTVCDANREHLNALGGNGTPVHRVYNGIDLEEFRAEPRRPGARFEILGVGRLVPKKGFDLLVRACRLLRDGGLDFRCRIVGQGDEAESLRRLVAEEGLADRVVLTGALTDREVRLAMAESDLFVLPARIAADGNRDALPTVFLEAMAMGLPSVGSDVTGIPEILGNGIAGEIVPPERPDLLAAAIARLAADEGMRARMGEAGRARAAKLFDVRNNVSQLHGLFRQSAAEGRVLPDAPGAGVLPGEREREARELDAARLS